jgi:hypothetical protein
MGSANNIDVTIIPERALKWPHLKCRPSTTSWLPTLQAWALSSFFRADFDVKIDCRPHVPQTSLFIKYTLSFGYLKMFFMLELQLYLNEKVSHDDTN